jgi:conjugative transfer signal peptidase TraF
MSKLAHLRLLWLNQRSISRPTKSQKTLRPAGSDHDMHGAILLVMASAVAGMTVTMGAKPTPRYMWNATASVPIGFYRVDHFDALAVGNLVVVMPPEPLASFLADGGYLPLGVPLIKQVLALPGQSVCRTDRLISVDGHEMGVALARDHLGRALPNWQGCRSIGQNEIFLMNRDEPASLDGRYFGPIPASGIIGRAEPMWTFKDK